MSCYFEGTKSDFPEFQKRYETMLIPENPDRFDYIAARAHFSMYHHDLWRGTAQRFAEMIVRECASCCGSQTDRDNILKHFGIAIESNVKYPAPDKTGSVSSQYQRQYNLPNIQGENK